MAERVALLNDINEAAVANFAQNGFEVVEFPKSMTTPDLAQLVTDVQALGVRSGPAVPAEVLKSGLTLEAVGCFCAGTNHVDRGAATERGIAIFNAVHENTRSVAEYVSGVIFCLLRRFGEHNMSLHNGTWTKTDAKSYEVRGKTLGIIGYGAIGSQVAVLAENDGMSVLYYDPDPKFPPYGNSQRVNDMDALLTSSDIVTVHVPGGRSTKNLVGETAILSMRPGSYLINTSRGDVVDYDAVKTALRDGHLAAVAADVFVDEPRKNGDPFDHPLRGEANALLTPHIAGSTQESQRDIGRATSLKLIGYLATGRTAGSVNLPELALTAVPKKTTRVLHLHHNVPGVVADLNGILAEAGLNIVSQHLQVRGAIGYVATDVETDVPEEVIQEIAKTESTIRTRALVSSQSNVK